MQYRDGFDINVVDYPAKYLIGIRIRTTIPRSTIDCPPVWNQFSSRLSELPGASRRKTYGLFLMVDKRITFDHWAAVEMPRNAKIPPGMEVFELPGGKFVHCFVPNSAALLLAYSALYGSWPQEQDEYDVDMTGPCFELYPPQWQQHEAFDLYVPVRLL